MFNLPNNRSVVPAKDTNLTLNQRQALKELEAKIPDIRMTMITNPDAAPPFCQQVLQQLYELDEKVEEWNEKEQHKRDVLEMSLLNFLGQALIESSNWKGAADAYERCLALGARMQLPDFQVASLMNLGKAYRHAGNLQEAALRFERADVLCQLYGLYAQQAEALYQWAVVAELQHQSKVALQAYERGLELSESERLYDLAIRFLSQLGQLQQTLGNYTAALDNYERCLKYLRETDEDKESETIILGQISHVCVQINDFERGLKAAHEGLDYSRQTKQSAEETAFLGDLARLYFSSNNYEQARHYASMSKLMAEHRQDQQALQEAEQLLSQLQDDTPDIEQTPLSFRTLDAIQLPEVHYQRGNYYYREGALDRAIAAYSRAINLDEGYVSAYINRGSAYTAKGNYDRALADYNRAVELDPNDLAGRFNRGNLYRKRRQYPLALQDYSAAIKIDPGDPDAYFNRGEVLRRMRRYAEAAHDFEMVVRLSAGKDDSGAAQARRLLEDMQRAQQQQAG
jgi:tetratricopeptide (TPR) repeat protein